MLDHTCYLGGLAFSGSQLEIADCSGLLTPAGTYPAGYTAICESDAQILCEASLACPSTSDPTKVIACAAALDSGISCSSDSTFVEIPNACQ